MALDYGTTTLEVAKTLKNNFECLTVLTNSLVIANELSSMPKYTIIVAGGVLKTEEFSLYGQNTENEIGQYHVDTSFISVSGISLKAGITDYILDSVSVQKKMIEISDKVIVLAYSSKFDNAALSKICEIDRVNMIITDSGLSKNIYDKYTKRGIKIVSSMEDI